MEEIFLSYSLMLLTELSSNGENGASYDDPLDDFMDISMVFYGRHGKVQLN